MAFLSAPSRRLVGVVLGAAMSLAAATSTRAVPTPTDAEVKAAFLCGFAEFVDWPSSAAKDGSVTIGILGEDPFGALLDETVKNRTLRTRALAVRRVSSLEEALRCQIVFVSGSEKRKLDGVLRGLGQSNILTVSDIEGFADHGGVIGFTVEDKRVRFQVNLGAAERAQLQISSRLLKLARIVSTDAKKGAPE